MDKTIGYELIVKRVHGFSDARQWITRLVGAGIVRCGKCGGAANHVSWTDQAEWYPRCGSCYESGEQWTGSTRWNPTSFSIGVLKEPAEAWLSRQSDDERGVLSLESYDSTDYYALMTDTETRHYLVGSPETWHKVFVDVTLLTNGEYVYQLAKAWGGEHVSTTHFEAVIGTWESEAEALAAARIDLNTPREMLIEEDEDIDIDDDDFDSDEDVYEDDGLWDDPNEAIVPNQTALDAASESGNFPEEDGADIEF